MAARQTQEMKKARKLVEAGMTAYAAAKQCGITRSAIYMAPWYKEFKANVKKL